MAGPYEADAALMRKVAAGDQRACRKLAALYLAPTWRVALACAGRADLADDLAQEAMLRLWRAAPKWQPKARVSTWLYRVVQNLWIDELRKTRPQVNDLPDLIDDGADQAAQYDAGQRARSVEQAIAALPPRQRVAITLFYYEALSINDGAKAMGIGADAFQSLIARARRGLKALLEDQAQELMEGFH